VYLQIKTPLSVVLDLVVQAQLIRVHNDDKVVIFERAGLLFVFNFHPTTSYSDYRFGVETSGK